MSTTQPVKTVLFVCTANICRSPMAAALLRRRLAAMRLADQVRVESAGTWARDGWPANENAVAALADLGIELEQHYSQPVTAPLLDAADIILVMEESHRRSIFYLAPNHVHKVLLISELAGRHEEIADPYGGPIEGYVATAAQLDVLIKLGLPRLLERIGLTSEASAKRKT